MAGLVILHLSMGYDTDTYAVYGEETNYMAESITQISPVDIELFEEGQISESERVSETERISESERVSETGSVTEVEIVTEQEMNNGEGFSQETESNENKEQKQEPNEMTEYSEKEMIEDLGEEQTEISEFPETSPVPLKAEFQMSVTEDIPVVKAGQQVGYEIILKNTGDVNLKYLELRSILDNGNMEGEWLETDGLTIDDTAGTATLSLLEAGAERKIVLMALIPEERQNNLEAEFLAKVENPLADINVKKTETEEFSAQPETSEKIPEKTGYEDSSQEETFERLPQEEYLCRSVSLTTEIIPLKIEYTVKKWADRARAVPGDTITYQICIRNTGERSLHSVLTTEKFKTAGLKASFLEKEGVILNGEKTEALIAEIKPGEAFGLYATVTLPEDFEGGDLLNEVTVVTRETGENTLSAQATVEVEKTLVTTAPVEENGAIQQISTNHSTGKVIPQTADLAETELWAGAFGVSCLIIIGIYWGRKAKRKR